MASPPSSPAEPSPSSPAAPADDSPPNRPEPSLTQLLSRLQYALKRLPGHLPLGRTDGRLRKNFPANPNVESSDPPIMAFRSAWTQVFRPTDSDYSKLVQRGENGITRALSFLVFYSKLSRIHESDGVAQLTRHAEFLLDLVKKATGNSAEESASDEPATAQTVPKGKRRRKNHGMRLDASDSDQQERVAQPSKRARTEAEVINGSSSEDEEEEDETAVELLSVKSGRSDQRKQWALGQFTEPKAHQIARHGVVKKVWAWYCQHCNQMRTSPRSTSSTSYKDETIAFGSSNFISHFDKCKRLPEDQTYLVWLARTTGAAPANPGSSSQLQQQRSLLRGFTDRGYANPAREVTQKTLREHWVMAVIQDDMAFSQAEREGLKRFLTFSIPQMVIPSHQTIRRDLDILHGKLALILKDTLKECTSMIACGSDLWTSRSSVYSYCGAVVWLIDGEWLLHEHVLDLIPLDGDHSGKASGKVIFNALQKQGVSKKLIALTSDNTSSNGTQAKAVAKHIQKVHDRHVDAHSMQVGCAAHVLNLSVQAILHALGSAPDPDTSDLFEIARSFPIAFDPLQDEGAEEEHQLATHGGLNGADERAIPDEESDSDDHEHGIDEDEPEDGGVGTSTKEGRKDLNAVQKLHCIVVDITKSNGRRGKFRKLVHIMCAIEHHELALIKSMPVRWNTTYFEIERGQHLRPAIDTYVTKMAENLSGKRKAQAVRRQEKWSLSPHDWDLLSVLLIILEVYHAATLDLSIKEKPTICLVLFFYKVIENHLTSLMAECRRKGRAVLARALDAGRAKLRKHLCLALDNKYILLGAILHPRLRLQFFENTNDWDPSIPVRGQTLLKSVIEDYSRSNAATTAPPTQPAPTATASNTSFFSRSISVSTTASAPPITASLDTEINQYCAGLYPCINDDVLLWWKLQAASFPTLARVARDVLAISGVSVSIERLFSSSKHTLRDAWASLSSISGSKAVVTKSWLKEGLGDGLEYLDGVSIRRPRK